MVLTMIPGIFAGLDSAQIDYDAVAYRTSVILCEDPGWPSGEDSWEFVDTAHKDDIDRLGLAISSNSPNILSKQKVNSFFNNNEDLAFIDEDYRSKTIFGDIPYYYNISLRIDDDPVNTTGNIAPDSSYGYMRRLVKFKEPGYAVIDSGDYNDSHTDLTTVDTRLSISFNYTELQNKSIDEAYRFMMQKEPAWITINNFTNSLNQSDILNVTLTDISFKKNKVDGTPLSFKYAEYDNDTYRFFIDGDQKTMEGPFDIRYVNELKFEMYPPLRFSNEAGSSLFVVFNIEYDYVPDDSIEHYYISGDIPYDYGDDYMTKPYLREGVMEVMIW